MYTDTGRNNNCRNIKKANGICYALNRTIYGKKELREETKMHTKVKATQSKKENKLTAVEMKHLRRIAGQSYKHTEEI